MSHDSENRRVGSIVAPAHQAWREACAWFGTFHRGHGSQNAAAREGDAHDQQMHA